MPQKQVFTASIRMCDVFSMSLGYFSNHLVWIKNTRSMLAVPEMALEPEWLVAPLLMVPVLLLAAVLVLTDVVVVEAVLVMAAVLILEAVPAHEC